MTPAKTILAFAVLSLISCQYFLGDYSSNRVLSSDTPMQQFTLGKGFSSDSDSLAPLICFNTSLETTEGQKGEIDFSKSQSFEEISKSLGLDYGMRAGYGQFSGELAANYSKNIADTMNSFSYSFVAKYTEVHSLNYSRYPNILNDNGQKILESSPLDFCQICGDYVIKSYEKGSILIMSLILQFESHYEKEEFSAGFSISNASYFQLSASIMLAKKNLNINIKVSIKAQQFGGDPSQLSRILGKEVIECSVDKMDKCDDLANNIIIYARDNYAKQLEGPNANKTPLGAFSKESLKKFGMKNIQCSANKEVVDARADLIKWFKVIEYYFVNISNTIESLPIPATDARVKQYKQLRANISKLYDKFLGEDNALSCWTQVSNCLDYYSIMKDDNKVEQKIVEFEAAYDKLIANLKYAYVFNVPVKKDEFQCLKSNTRWKQNKIYHITRLPFDIGKYIFKFESEIVKSPVSDANSFTIEFNPNLHPNMINTMKVVFQESSDEKLTGTLDCSEVVYADMVQYTTQIPLSGTKYITKYYFEKYVEIKAEDRR